jgi:hypothetical protein
MLLALMLSSISTVKQSALHTAQSQLTSLIARRFHAHGQAERSQRSDSTAECLLCLPSADAAMLVAIACLDHSAVLTSNLKSTMPSDTMNASDIPLAGFPCHKRRVVGVQ